MGIYSGLSSMRLVIASDHALIAEAVAAALESRGCHAVRVPWPDEFDEATDGERPPLVPVDTGLAMCELTNFRHLRKARVLVAAVPVPWLLLTSAPRGPLWGALLEVGVRSVLPSGTTLDEVVFELSEVAAGRGSLTEPVRRALRRDWHVLRDKQDRLEARMRSLTPRERSVLALLHAGDSVQSIAELYEVSESTVRSQVRAVFRKLDVRSQLAAVSIYSQLIDDGSVSGMSS